MGLSEANLQFLQLKSEWLMDKQIIEITGHQHENSVAQHMSRIATKLRTKDDRKTIAKASALDLLRDQHQIGLNIVKIEENGKLVAKQEGRLGEIV